MASGKKRAVAIVGGGPKSAAICAKAACLRSLFDIDLTVTVFEKDRVGASWTGNHGYSDGEQRLCTPAERDLGFPYSEDTFGGLVPPEMQARFSWPAHAVRQGIHAAWVDSGRPPPTHGQFAAYLDAAIKASGANLIRGEATRAQLTRGLWTITSTGASGPVQHGPFNGVVMTGTGPAARRVRSVPDARVLDGVSFWHSLATVRSAVRASREPVVIVGSGGTAAAIAAKLIRERIDTDIVMLGTQAALYARSDNLFENQLFHDSETWESLSDADRRDFTDRLTRGAVWSSVINLLSGAPRLRYLPARANETRYVTPSNPAGDLLVEYETSGHPGRRLLLPASAVVDATGFDPLWFARLLDKRLRDALARAEPHLRSRMSASLALPLPVVGQLHAPMLSQSISPAFTSLMALGDMSDAILKPYVEDLTS